MRIEVKVEGIEEVVRWLEGPFNRAAQQASDIATDETLEVAKEDAQAAAPVDTGAHRKSIRKERYARPRGHFTYQGLRAGGYVTNPKTGRIVDYSHFLEYGTSKMFPRPHIRPAVRNALKNWHDRFYKALGRLVKLG